MMSLFSSTTGINVPFPSIANVVLDKNGNIVIQSMSLK